MAEVQPEERWRTDAEARLASLAKPPGALGTLEDWCVTLCVAQKTLRPTVSTAALVFCADHNAPTPATPADDDDDDGFECLGSVTAEERAAAARRAAEAEGNVLEVESPPQSRRSFPGDADATFLPVPRHVRSAPRTPEGALPPVPTFMGRGTARRPVEPPAPAPSFGTRANYDPVLDE